MVERSWVLTGRCEDATGGEWRLRREPESERSGGAASVEADWAWALAREEACDDVAGFWHTHPPRGGTRPSDRDIHTMRAWRLALGKPLVCVIADGRRRAAYIFETDESDGTTVGTVSWLDRAECLVRVRPAHRE